MTMAATGQVNTSAAEIYEAFFVPALFAEWAAPVAEAAGISRGDAVLDVACGTGILTREVAGRVRPVGTVVGLDRNEGMLAVAAQAEPTVDWRHGMAEALPFADARFDAVVSQFGLMFFEDRAKAISEMWRVLKPGGRLAVAVWGSLDETPGYAAMTALLGRLFGREVADALRAPFVLGDRNELGRIFDAAGIAGCEIDTSTGTTRFPSIEAWVRTDVKGWTLADLIDDEQYALLQREAQNELQDFTLADGSVAFPGPAHIVTAAKS